MNELQCISLDRSLLGHHFIKQWKVSVVHGLQLKKLAKLTFNKEKPLVVRVICSSIHPRTLTNHSICNATVQGADSSIVNTNHANLESNRFQS